MADVTATRPTATPTATPVAPTQQPAQQPQAIQPIQVSTPRYGYDTGSAFEASTSGTGPGGIGYDAHVSGPRFQIEGGADAKVGLGGIDVNVNVDVKATLAEAGANATKTFQVDVGGKKLDVTVDLKAQGVVGADGHLNLNIHIGTDGKVNVSAAANGFAGAKASLTGGITVKSDGRELASGSVTLSGSAGVSADAHANVELSGGKIKFDIGAEATAGAGFGVDVDGNIDAGNTARFLAEVLGGLADQGVDWAKDELGKVNDWVGDRFEDVGNFIKDHLPHLDWPF